MTHYDVIVIGLGGMGSAAAYRLAQRGQRVIGIDQFAPVHNLGSSHGGSRITRQAYLEGPDYVPLLLRAHELWDEVERDTGRHLFTRCGGLMAGSPDSRTITGSVLSAEKFDIPHELLDAPEIRRRFPTMAPRDDEVALYEPGAGFVSPEGSVAAHLQLAARHGAELHHEEQVFTWSTSESGVRVGTASSYYTASRLVLCPGAWAPSLLADLGVDFEVQRQVQYWFEPADAAAFAAERHPVYLWETEQGEQFYGFPAHSPQGVKVASHLAGTPCTADTIDRRVHDEEVRAVTDLVGSRLPALGAFRRAATCLYTNTPDEDFVIARHPAHPRVVVACGFSGHGFKFVPVVGEIVADLIVDGSTTHPIALFDPARFEPARFDER
ncbi:N-methyl-L-tryptophan oxidase [Amycolatopsis sp. DSM 110486]|uniref:N-methyl-L-tryptophan oxidase n=1 Tax=Amycolatopsis sp. DSM 110486 TaxID=2865832 RepID=UPI001C6A4BC5|nr:N-methyl-L-tryptophan oxidase [Amycolatopsis sp. DSM 110486]QYN22805.1 N-methyl-L-tryptophan oxidase [Amycolatopsis sp. DSM 110486]